MKNEYIIINKTAIQKRIEELKKQSKEIEQDESMNTLFVNINGQSSALKNILSQSTPLIPLLESAFNAARSKENFIPFISTGELRYNTSKDYISNLKLNI